jgi:hypothetical protein
MKDHGQITWVPDAAYRGGGYYRGSGGRILRLKAPRTNPKETGPPPSTSAGTDPPDTPPARPGPSDRVRESLSRLRPSRIDRSVDPLGRRWDLASDPDRNAIAGSCPRTSRRRTPCRRTP